MISPAELAALQATANSAGDQTITIQRATKTPDGAGGSSLAYNTVATVTGNLAQPSGQLMQNYDYLIGTTSTWMVRMPVGTNVKEGDRLEVTDGQTLLVQVVLQPQSYQTSLRLLASEVQ